MNQNDQQPTFMDGKTIIAIMITMGVFIGWQQYLKNKYPDYGKPQAEVSQPAKSEAATADLKTNPTAAKSNTAEASTASGAEQTAPVAVNTRPDEAIFTFEDDRLNFEISSYGMGLKGITLKQYKDREGATKRIQRGKTNLSVYQTFLSGQSDPLIFDIQQVDETTFKGVANSQGVRVVKTLKVVSDNYTVEQSVSVTGNFQKFDGLSMAMAKQIEVTDGGSVFMPNFNIQSFYYQKVDESDEREILTVDTPLAGEYKQARVVALSSQYFALGFLDRSAVYPDVRFSTDIDKKVASVFLNYPKLLGANQFEVKMTGFIGPKSLSILEGIDPQMSGIIDYGFFSLIAKYLFWCLDFFHSLFGNWGVAIIVLTLIVRLLLMPLNLASFKSMQKMKDINPKIQAIRDRIKDKNEQGQAIMALYREEQINPLGGCLPMILQLPIFFALYQVLGQSIELYQSPFMLWIDDLSLKDPYFVLPILMAITMFFQQKLTPTTVEPAMQKMMMIMPVFFAFFMMGLPSGLTLYIFISGLFAIVQQGLLLRQNVSMNQPIGQKA